MKRYLFLFTILILSSAHSPASESPPGAAIIELQKTRYSMVSIDPTASAYQNLVSVQKEIEIPIKWSQKGGALATSVKYQLNGVTVAEKILQRVRSGQDILTVDQGGNFRLDVQLCNNRGCTSAKKIHTVVVEDTNGSHMSPLVLKDGENNRPYSNETDAVVGSYFVEWSEGDRDFPVTKVPAYNLTHILYGFIPVCGENASLKAATPKGHASLKASCEGQPDYSVTLHDMEAAVLKSQTSLGKESSYQGNFGQLMALKRAYPELTILPSVGGWSLSDPFYGLVEAKNRKIFVDSVEQLLRTWKFFDGVDIDWEYPGGGGANSKLGNPTKDGEAYRLLMQELREMLDSLEAESGREFQLTTAVGATPSKINNIDYQATQQFLDYIFIMSYDFYGAWDTRTLGHMAGVHAPGFRANSDQTKTFNLAGAVDTFLAQGVSPKKLVAGVAKYGRGWTAVNGFDASSHLTGQGTGPVKGTWEAGSLDYRDIANKRNSGGWSYYFDDVAKSPYIVNDKTGDLISYDDAKSVQAKGELVKTKGLAGLFSWEIDGDNGDLLNAMHESLGHKPGNIELEHEVSEE